MNMPARPLGQPISDQGGLMGGVVVPDQMHIEADRHVGLDFIEELAEFGSAMTRIALTDDFSRCNVERSEQRRRAMPDVVVAASLRLARPHRKHLLATVESLDLGF